MLVSRLFLPNSISNPLSHHFYFYKGHQYPILIHSQRVLWWQLKLSLGVVSLLWPRIKALLPSSLHNFFLFTPNNNNLHHLKTFFTPSSTSAYSRSKTPRSAPSPYDHPELRLLFVFWISTLPISPSRLVSHLHLHLRAI